MEHFVTDRIVSAGYLAVFLLMVAESACIPIPSEAIMLFGGALASGAALAGVGHATGHLNVVVVGLLGALGNLVGSWIAYGVGRVGGRPLAERWGRVLRVRPHDLDRADAWFARRGELAVLIGRCVPIVRTFISLPAGVAEMPFWRFSLFTIAGSLPWTFGLAIAGYAVASHWKGVADGFRPVTYVVAAVVVIGLGWGVLRWWRRAPSEVG
ncbi:MAG TPA: DedA family protein [Acidimicrobiales bacterium]|nr:DedA family protein [Acidimicrobiales bacterium]